MRDRGARDRKLPRAPPPVAVRHGNRRSCLSRARCQREAGRGGALSHIVARSEAIGPSQSDARLRALRHEGGLARNHGRLAADRQEPSEALVAKTTRLKEKLAKLKEEMERLKGLEARMLAAPDQQISLTDPDSRSMATSGRGSGVVGYNVQVAVDTEHHLIVTHEVTNIGNDRAQLARVGKETKATLQTEKLEAVADRGYFSGEEILTCDQAAQTDYIGRQGQGPVWQAGLRLSARGRRLSLSVRRAAEVLLHQRRKRAEATQLLDQRLPDLRAQKPVHDYSNPPHQTLGA